MAESNKKDSSAGVSIDDIYKFLKERNFAEDLWMEMLSDIKEKPTYKRMKEVVTFAVNNKLKDFRQEPANHAERAERRAALTEMSIMAYTVDRVISEVLYKRLENEFKTLIRDLLDELQTKKPLETSSTPVKINSMLENIERIFSEQFVAEEVKVKKRPKKVNSDKPPAKRGRPRGSRTKPKEIPQIKEVDSDANLSLDSISSVHTTDLSSFDDNVSVCTDDEILGHKKKVVSLKKANSMIVEGKLPQVYQIGTRSEKTKAISGKEAKKDQSLVDKETKKDKGSAKEAKKDQGLAKEAKKDQGLAKETKKDQGLAKEAKKGQGLSKEAKKGQGLAKETKKAEMDSTPRKVLPQRKRKPNTKYNAETMYCYNKDYFSDRSDSPQSNPADDIATILSQVNNKKPKLVESSSDEDKDSIPKNPVPTRLDSNPSQVNKKAKVVETSHDDDERTPPESPVSSRPVRNQFSSDSDAPVTPIIPKNSTQRYSAVDLYKPRFSFGSNSSTRGTDAAFNVFSS